MLDRADVFKDPNSGFRSNKGGEMNNEKRLQAIFGMTLILALLAGCAPKAQVVEVEVTVPPQVEIV